MVLKTGDVEKGFAEADVVIERTFTTRPVHQGYIEPHACTVSYAADGRVTIWSSSQGQFMVRAMTSLLTGIPQSNIRAIPAEIGGGFGAKTIVYLEPVAVMLSKKSGRPVKMVMTRDEVMRATGPAPGSLIHRQDRREEGRHHRRRRRAPSTCRPAGCPVRRCAGRWVLLRGLCDPEHPVGRL